MQRKTLRFGKGFRVAFNVRRVQAAEMVLAPGDTEGDEQAERQRGQQPRQSLGIFHERAARHVQRSGDGIECDNFHVSNILLIHRRQKKRPNLDHRSDLLLSVRYASC